MLVLQEKLSAESPNVPRYLGELETGDWVLGNFLRDTGRPEKAEEAYRKSLAICGKQVAAFPTNADNRAALAFRCYSLGPLLAASDRSQEADQLYRKALTFTPDGPDGHNYLALLLLICPEPKFRDPARAVELAKKATDLAPKFGYIWNTLGMAYYRAGNHRDAVQALENAIQFGNGGDGWDWIFLAMAHWQLGDKADAREWYDKASQWMEKDHSPKDELWRELRSYRVEAAELLGIKDTQKRM
jgi:tetratricopeptide (TPR) repeat protein